MGVWGKPGGETTISGPPPLSFAACRYRVEQGRGGGATDARAKRREARNLPEAGSRGVLWADGAPGAGLAARPQQCAFGAQRGPEPANGGRSGAAVQDNRGGRGAWLAACAGGCGRGAPSPEERPPFCAAASSSSGEVGRRLLRLAGCCLPSESVRVGFVPTSSGLMLSTKWFDTPHNSAIARLDRLANSLTANSTHRRLSALLRRWP